MESTAIAQGRHMARESLRPIVPTINPRRIRLVRTCVLHPLCRCVVLAWAQHKHKVVAGALRIRADRLL